MGDIGVNGTMIYDHWNQILLLQHQAYEQRGLWGPSWWADADIFFNSGPLPLVLQPREKTTICGKTWGNSSAKIPLPCWIAMSGTPRVMGHRWSQTSRHAQWPHLSSRSRQKYGKSANQEITGHPNTWIVSTSCQKYCSNLFYINPDCFILFQYTCHFRVSTSHSFPYSRQSRCFPSTTWDSPNVTWTIPGRMRISTWRWQRGTPSDGQMDIWGFP